MSIQWRVWKVYESINVVDESKGSVTPGPSGGERGKPAESFLGTTSLVEARHMAAPLFCAPAVQDPPAPPSHLLHAERQQRWRYRIGR
jgi:hypothetical protein